MANIFQLDPSVPGAAEINPLIAVTQNSFNFLQQNNQPDLTNQAAKAIQATRSSYDPSDAASPAGKINKASGLVGDAMTQVQQMIYGYGTVPSDFVNVVLPDSIVSAIKANPGPSDMWNLSPAQLGLVTVAGVAPLVVTGSVINKNTGKRFDNVLILPASPSA